MGGEPWKRVEMGKTQTRIWSDLLNPVPSAVCGDLGEVPVGGGNSPSGSELLTRENSGEPKTWLRRKERKNLGAKSGEIMYSRR